MSQKVFIKLFPNCIPVRGFNRSVICDLQRSKYVLVPNSLISMFDDAGLLHKETIETMLDEEERSVFYTYLNMLEQSELILYCDEEELLFFPPLSTTWDFPSVISNMIIDIDRNSLHNYAEILFQSTEKLQCAYFQFRHYDESSLDLWKDILSIVNDSSIQAIDIILKESPDNFTYSELAEWAYKNRKIRSVTIHSCSEEKVIQAPDFGFGAVLAIKENIHSNNHCGIIHPTYFSINILHYTESLAHNTCLNRKIAIDVDGNIKNCPSMKENFGNIKDITLEEAINKPGFKKYWNITKDEITKCKDCEFRHICTDCRAFVDNPGDMYSAPLKCGYNPYTCEWEEWSTNPLKQQSIEYYGMSEMIKQS